MLVVESAITPTVDAPEPVRPNEKDTQTKGPECEFLLISTIIQGA